MDIINHGLFNLKIETTNHSSSPKEEEEVKRNWLELPADVMSLILLKVGAIHILTTAQWVCTSWWKLSKQPHLFRSINFYQLLSKGLVREAIDRSCGQLVEFSVRYAANDELLHHISQKTKSLRALRLADCIATKDGLIDVCKRFPQLEELEVCSCHLLIGVSETVGCLCPHLKSFRINYFHYECSDMLDNMALDIAKTMPELCHLDLYGNCLTDAGLRAILSGCPHLQSLDLRRCFNLKFEGDLQEMSAHIKLRLPNDSIDDFECVFAQEFYDDYDLDYYYAYHNPFELRQRLVSSSLTCTIILLLYYVLA